jgi:quercetin 2,3-dioxygenase
VVMWWNFVGTTPQDIIDAARDWAHSDRFGQVTGYHGAPLPAPPLDAVRLRGSAAPPRGGP